MIEDKRHQLDGLKLSDILSYCDCWVAEPSSLEIDPPIAWCEIPKFEEEQNG